MPTENSSLVETAPEYALADEGTAGVEGEETSDTETALESGQGISMADVEMADANADQGPSTVPETESQDQNTPSTDLTLETAFQVKFRNHYLVYL